MEKIAMVVEKTSTGFSAYARDYDFMTTGKDWSDLLKNMLEAANLFFDDQDLSIREDDIEALIEN